MKINTKKHKECVLKYLEGYDIESRMWSVNGNYTWSQCPDPAWLDNYEYRTTPCDNEECPVEECGCPGIITPEREKDNNLFIFFTTALICVTLVILYSINQS